MEFQQTFTEFLQFCSVERRQSEHTISAYRFDLLDFRKWLPPQKELEAVTEEDLKLYLEDMVSKRNLSVATVRRRLACLRGFFRRQAELGRHLDPFGSWRPKLPRRRRLPRALAKSEVRSLLGPNAQSRKNERDIETAVRLMVATGLRVGELCRLRLEDLSPDCTVIRVRRRLEHGD